MSKKFLSSENFKTRLSTGVMLSMIVILSLVSKNANIFRFLFFCAGIMAIFELFLAQRMQFHYLSDDGILLPEYLILILAIFAIV